MGATIVAHMAETCEAINFWLQREFPDTIAEVHVLPAKWFMIPRSEFVERYACDGEVTRSEDGEGLRIRGATYWAFWSVDGQLHMVVAVGVNRDSLFQAIQDARLTAV